MSTVDQRIARVDSLRKEGRLTQSQAQDLRREIRASGGSNKRLGPAARNAIDQKIRETAKPRPTAGSGQEEELIVTPPVGDPDSLEEDILEDDDDEDETDEQRRERERLEREESERAERELTERRERETGLAYLTNLLTQYGLESLIGSLDDLIREYGFNETIIMSRLRKEDAYKQRFSGIQKRIDAGFSAITEATYLSMEDEYKKVMRNYGLDPSFYDRDRLAELIGFDVSEAEVESRIGTGQRIMQNANQTVLRELQEYYPEITDGDLLSYVLAPAIGQDVLAKKIRTGLIGGTAEQAGFTMDFTASDRLARTSVGQTIDPFDVGTQAQLEQTFGRARETARTERTLAGIDREAYTDMDTLEAAFGDTEKQLASQRRGRRERARFAGESGVGRSSLSSRSRRAL